MERAKQPPTSFLARHAIGDWGELEPTEVAENEYSVAHGFRLLSSYPSGDLRQFALLAWSMVHGIAKLATAKRLPYQSRADILKFAKFVIDESLPVRAEVRK